MPGASGLGNTAPSVSARCDFARLFGDAIRYAEDGFAIASPGRARLARLRERTCRRRGRRAALPGRRAPLCGARSDGLPALAETLARDREGRRERILRRRNRRRDRRHSRGQGRFLSEEDLADGVGRLGRRRSRTSYRGHDILEIPPNGQGITALILLESVSTSSARREGLAPTAPSAASAARGSAVSPIPCAITVVSRSGDDDRARVVASAVRDFSRDGSSARLSIRAAQRRIVLPPDAAFRHGLSDRGRPRPPAVSFINSLYRRLRRRLVTPNTGIALQNRGACFVVEPGHPNEFGPAQAADAHHHPGDGDEDGKAAVSLRRHGRRLSADGHAQVVSNIARPRHGPAGAAIDAEAVLGEEDGVLEAEAGIGEVARKDLERSG